jgi:hypothetical protein
VRSPSAVHHHSQYIERSVSGLRASLRLVHRQGSISFAVNLNTSQAAIAELASTTEAISFQMDRHSPGVAMGGKQVAADELSAYLKTNGQMNDRTFAAIGTKCREISEALEDKTSLTELNPEQRRVLRSDLYLTSESLGKAIKQKKITEPAEVMAAAMGTILAADRLGLPVSTTHVLSSGVAGTMAANGSGLQMDTVRNLLLAWVLTLPVCVLLGAGIFAFGINILFRMGIK